MRILSFFFCLLLVGCASTEIFESPKTGYVSDTAEAKTPEIIWTSRTLSQEFDYLAQLKVRSWSYNGALERLMEAGRKVKADAVIDVHYERVGFLTAMHAFAVKFR